MFSKNDLRELHQLARQGLSEAATKALDVAIGEERTMLEVAKPDLEQLGLRPMACSATFRKRAEEVGRTSF